MSDEASASEIKIKISREIKTSKCEEQALCENYLYYKKRFNKKINSTYWQCKDKQCNASLTTSSDNTVQKVNGKKLLSHEPMRITETHEHGPIKSDILKLKEQMSKQNLRVQNEVDMPIGHIFQEEQANFVNAMNGDMEKVAELFPQWIQN